MRVIKKGTAGKRCPFLYKTQINILMEKQEELERELAQFCGTENLYAIAMIRTYYTDGIRFLAEQTNCFWLIIDSSIVARGLMNKSSFIVVDFKKYTNRVRNVKYPEAIVTYSDGNGKEFYSQEYYITDFPLDELRLFFVDSTLMLPGEY